MSIVLGPLVFLWTRAIRAVRFREAISFSSFSMGNASRNKGANSSFDNFNHVNTSRGATPAQTWNLKP